MKIDVESESTWKCGVHKAHILRLSSIKLWGGNDYFLCVIPLQTGGPACTANAEKRELENFLRRQGFEELKNED